MDPWDAFYFSLRRCRSRYRTRLARRLAGLGWALFGFAIFLAVQLHHRNFFSCFLHALVTGYVAYLIANPWMMWTVGGVMGLSFAKAAGITHGIHLVHGGIYCLFAIGWWAARKFIRCGWMLAPAIWLICESIYPALFAMRHGCLLLGIEPLATDRVGVWSAGGHVAVFRDREFVTPDPMLAGSRNKRNQPFDGSSIRRRNFGADSSQFFLGNLSNQPAGKSTGSLYWRTTQCCHYPGRHRACPVSPEDDGAVAETLRKTATWCCGPNVRWENTTGL